MVGTHYRQVAIWRKPSRMPPGGPKIFEIAAAPIAPRRCTVKGWANAIHGKFVLMPLGGRTWVAWHAQIVKYHAHHVLSRGNDRRDIFTFSRVTALTRPPLARAIAQRPQRFELRVQSFRDTDQQRHSYQKVDAHKDNKYVLRPDLVPNNTRNQGQTGAQNHLEKPANAQPPPHLLRRYQFSFDGSSNRWANKIKPL